MNSHSIPQPLKRAAIYVRTSTERQGQKISPKTQEDDCKELCERKGYRVAGIYADSEKYRVGRKLMEPSGTRADRPALKRLLADARAGRFDVIVAWREDRLYRSYRPMLDVLDCLDETGIDIELAKEFFDKKFAPVKAWAAKMELEAKHDRMMMGTAGRLQNGKPWNQEPPFGYARNEDGYWTVNEVEAAWLRKIFQWYADGMSVRVIRQRLIDGGAQQRETRKHVWSARVIYKYYQNDYLWTGTYSYNWDGKVYEINVPPIIQTEVAQKVVNRRSQFGKYPDGNAKHNCLCAGLVYCAHCDVRMSAINKTNGLKRKDGSGYRYEYYRCNSLGYPIRYEGCAKEVSSASVDREVWEKVWRFISQPEKFENALQERIAALEAQELDAKAECDKLVDDLAELGLERHKVVSAFRKSLITEDDLAAQLDVLSGQEKELRRELSDKQLLIGDRAERLSQLASAFRAQVAEGIEAINVEPITEEERKRQLEFRRKIVHEVVERVNVYADKSVSIELRIDLTEIMPISDHVQNCAPYANRRHFRDAPPS